MKSSIFQKQLKAFMIILVGSFLILGFLLTVFFSSYLQKDKIRSLEEQATRIANIYTKKYNPHAMITTEVFQRDLDDEFQSMLMYKNIHVFITDNLMQVEGYSSDISHFKDQQLLIPSLMDVLNGNNVYVVGDLDGMFDKKEITVGCPVIYRGNVAAAVFVSSDFGEIKNIVLELLKILILTSVVSIITAFVATYVIASNISQPLISIGEAASEIASGDFDKKIDIVSDDEIGQLAKSFNHMAESLHTIEQNRRDYISNLSHDIRSPLTSIRGFLQAILDGTIDKENQDYYLQIILEETDRISELANDTLILSQVEDDMALRTSHFDINELIRKNIMMLHSRITQKDLHIQILFADEMSYVEADEEKIKRVVNNLLDNAIKFSYPRTVLQVETTTEKEKILVSITNFGDVISEKDQIKIFDRFYKSDTSRGQDKKGTGLGLSIVKEFMKAHNETIVVTSTKETGTTFTFSLPLAHME